MPGYNESPTEQQLFDIGTTVIYVGQAAKNMTSAQPVWTIKKIVLDASGNPTTLTATAPYAGVWDNRATETYG